MKLNKTKIKNKTIEKITVVIEFDGECSTEEKNTYIEVLALGNVLNNARKQETGNEKRVAEKLYQIIRDVRTQYENQKR